jgi:hypothetical protein
MGPTKGSTATAVLPFGDPGRASAPHFRGRARVKVTQKVSGMGFDGRALMSWPSCARAHKHMCNGVQRQVRARRGLVDPDLVTDPCTNALRLAGSLRPASSRWRATAVPPAAPEGRGGQGLRGAISKRARDRTYGWTERATSGRRQRSAMRPLRVRQGIGLRAGRLRDGAAAGSPAPPATLRVTCPSQRGSSTSSRSLSS